MTTSYNLTPLYRTAIGFDRLARLVDAAQSATEATYPPYNIEKTGEDSYRLTMAVAGFGPDDIELTVKDGALHVAGRVQSEQAKAEVLHRGIASRAFERKFALADHIVVDGADLSHGLLHVALKRVVPEALKPRRVAINGAAPRIEAAGQRPAGHRPGRVTEKRGPGDRSPPVSRRLRRAEHAFRRRPVTGLGRDRRLCPHDLRAQFGDISLHLGDTPIVERRPFERLPFWSWQIVVRQPCSP